MRPYHIAKGCCFVDGFLSAVLHYFHLSGEAQHLGDLLDTRVHLLVAFLRKCESASRVTTLPEQGGHFAAEFPIDVLSSHTTPIRARTQYRELVDTLSRLINKSEAIPTEELIAHASEPGIIKELKAIGNLILQGHINQSIAWKMDYAEFFERYVQYLFASVARRKGCYSYGNEHFSISGNSKPRWGLAYLEPDLVLQKDGVQYIIDAKYKSHIFNWSDNSDDLKETFRHDLHQVIAYSSFSKTPHRNAMLVYPYNVFFHRVVNVRSPLDPTTVSVSLVGIPIGKKPLNDTVDNLASIISF